MNFLLSDDFVKKLSSLKEDYAKRTGINLEYSNQPHSISCFFGAKDIQARRKQIIFMNQWLEALKKDLLSTEVPVVSTKKYLRALSILVSVSLYLQFQIEKTYKVRSPNAAVLVQLLNEALGTNAVNLLDNDTKAYCLKTTYHFLSKEARFTSINTQLTHPLTQKQWQDFTNFVSNQDKIIKNKTDYPITKFITPIVAFPVQALGETAGFVVGDLIGKSLKSLQAKYIFLAAAGGGVMLAINSVSAQTTLFLLAPMYAERLLKALCGVSASWVLGKTGELVGKGVAMGIGLPLDLGWKLITKKGEMLIHGSTRKTASNSINGISLLNKSRFIEGEEFSLINIDSLINDLTYLDKEIQIKQTPCDIEFKPEQKLCFGGSKF